MDICLNGEDKYSRVRYLAASILHCMLFFRFVLKTDDDVFVEIFHLFNFVSAVYGFSPGPSLVRCHLIIIN